MRSLGVVIPTKNSMKYLPEHLERLSAWIDLAQQVVVVDSFSEDGTVDYIKKHLRHPGLQITEYPPGLYASWNHGICQLNTEFCYISTVGDFLTREGARHLVSTAEHLGCDVLVSNPEFVDEAGNSCAGPKWPMDDLVQTLSIREPRLLPSAATVTNALAFTGGALTGSCASDLFRTAVLKEYPFPSTVGTAGDGAWSLINAGRLRWAVTPEKVTTFRMHPSTASALELLDGNENEWYATMSTEMVQAWLACSEAEFFPQVVSAIRQLLVMSITYKEYCRQHNFNRRGVWPWYLNPRAWQVRIARNRIKWQVFEARNSILKDSV